MTRKKGCAKQNDRPQPGGTQTWADHTKEHDNRFSCVVCLMPALEMVYGRCQHRVCVACLYDVHGQLNASFSACPICLMHDSFAPQRPVIPEDTKMMQGLLGVRECVEENCKLQLWEWDMQQHIEECHKNTEKAANSNDNGEVVQRNKDKKDKPDVHTVSQGRVTRSSGRRAKLVKGRQSNAW